MECLVLIRDGDVTLTQREPQILAFRNQASWLGAPFDLQLDTFLALAPTESNGELRYLVSIGIKAR